MSYLSDYINQKLSGIDFEQELLRLIGEYNKLRNTFLFVYASAISKQIPAISLIEDDYYTIYGMLSLVNSKRCDVYLETPGGSGETAEEIVRFLRDKFEDVDFVISGEAKSAGTIMALSGNNILMTNSGSLGPIDAQIKIGRSVQSAYDYMEWVKEKRVEALKMGKLNPFDATMVAQISPGELNGVGNALDFAKDLVTDWLPKYKFKNWTETETSKTKVTDEMKEKRAHKIVKDLINHNKWRSHGRSIKISDLEKIGLKIEKIDSNPKLAEIVYKIQTVIKLLFETTNTFKIFATESEKLFVSAALQGNHPKLPPAPQKAEVVTMEIECQKCGKNFKIYAKFVDDPKIDVDFKDKGFVPFPKDSKIHCQCGFEIDISGFKNNLETQIGKKMLN